jgi:diacylglycerol kinase (ATP)
MSYIKKRIKSFQYGFNGIRFALSEPNMVIHLVATVLVVSAGFFFRVSNVEWMFLVLAIGFVIAAETTNTAIEKLTDLVSPGYNEQAGRVKDMAAGAVLISAITAVIVGLIVFLPKLFSN